MILYINMKEKITKKKSNPTFFLQIKYDRFFNALLNWLNLGVYPILIIQTFLFFVLILLTLLCDTHYYLDGWLSKLYLRDWLFTFCFLSPVENLKCISTLHDLAKFWIWETFKHTLIFFLKITFLEVPWKETFRNKMCVWFYKENLRK